MKSLLATKGHSPAKTRMRRCLDMARQRRLLIAMSFADAISKARKREIAEWRREARDRHKATKAATALEKERAKLARALRPGTPRPHGVPRKTPGTLYVIRNTVTRSIKIGFTKQDPRQRMRKLQQGCEFTLELLHVIKGTSELERSAHHICMDYRIGGEWFRPDALAVFERRIGEVIANAS